MCPRTVKPSRFNPGTGVTQTPQAPDMINRRNRSFHTICTRSRPSHRNFTRVGRGQNLKYLRITSWVMIFSRELVQPDVDDVCTNAAILTTRTIFARRIVRVRGNWGGGRGPGSSCCGSRSRGWRRPRWTIAITTRGGPLVLLLPPVPTALCTSAAPSRLPGLVACGVLYIGRANQSGVNLLDSTFIRLGVNWSTRTVQSR